MPETVTVDPLTRLHLARRDGERGELPCGSCSSPSHPAAKLGRRLARRRLRRSRLLGARKPPPGAPRPPPSARGRRRAPKPRARTARASARVTRDGAGRDGRLGLLRRRAGDGDAVARGQRADRLGHRLGELRASTSSSPWSGRSLAFCTSMLEPLSAATLPLAPIAPMGSASTVAAPAVELRAAAATRRGGAGAEEADPAPTVRCVGTGRCLHAGLLPLSCSFLFLRSRVSRSGSGSLAAQGVDRGQGRGPAGGVDAEEDADGQRDGQRAHGRRRAGRDRVADETG